MKPLEYPPADRGLYYTGTWMRHTSMGNVEVRLNADDGDNSLSAKTRVGVRYRPVRVQDLEELWPEGGSYNYGEGTALYVSRRVARLARKSACCEYYSVTWSESGVGMSRTIMWALIRDLPYPSFPAVIRAFKGGDATSKALTRDLIIRVTNRPNSYGIIVHGVQAGTLKDKVFIANDPDAPMTKIARRVLKEEGIAC